MMHKVIKYTVGAYLVGMFLACNIILWAVLITVFISGDYWVVLLMPLPLCMYYVIYEEGR